MSFMPIRTLAAAAALSVLLTAPAMAADRPDGQISISGGSVAFVAGVSWGKGTLSYHGRTYKLKIKGLSVGDIGASKFSASGPVYNLHRVSDISGTYAAAEAAATVGGGAGGVTMKNDKGVLD